MSTSPGATLHAVAAGLLLAGMTHIVAVLAIPHLSGRNHWHRFTDPASPNRTISLPRAEAGGQAAPFQDPAVAMAVCGFDLAAAPARVRLPVGLSLATLSAHGADGRSFYALTDRAARDGAIEIVLMTRGQLDEAIRNDDEDEPTGDVRVLAPAPIGIAVVRVVARLEGEYPAAVAAAARLTCRPESDMEER